MNDTIETAEHKGIESTAITGIAFVASYVDDFETSYRFYSDILGLRKQFDMGEGTCVFHIGDSDSLYLQGGTVRTALDESTARSSFGLTVGSVSAMFEKLSSTDVRIIHNEPASLGGDTYWFQFYDPSGNILEIVGGK